MPACVAEQAPTPPSISPLCSAQESPSLIDALTLVTRLHLLALCGLAVRVAHWRCPRPCRLAPVDGRGCTRRSRCSWYTLLRVLWHLSYQDLHDWLVAWPALAQACYLPTSAQGQVRVRVPAAQQWKRSAQAGAPVGEALLLVMVHLACISG